MIESIRAFFRKLFSEATDKSQVQPAEPKPVLLSELDANDPRQEHQWTTISKADIPGRDNR